LRAGNAVVGEHRNHAPGHHRHDEQHQVERDSQAKPRGQRDNAEPGEMHAEHRNRQPEQQGDKEVIPAVAALHERNANPRRNRERKRGVDRSGKRAIGS
jgi:hypothetical protein